MDDQEIDVLITFLKNIGCAVLVSVMGFLIDRCFEYILYRDFKETNEEEED